MNQDISNPPNHNSAPMPAEWVLAHYTGLQAKDVLALANSGVKYYVLRTPESGQGWCEVAFRRPTDSPCPEHLQKITDIRLIAKLEKMRAE